MRRVFLDTGYVIALEMSDDQHHEEAQAHWHEFIRQQPRLVTTSYVFDEIVTFFNSRSQHAKAVEVGQRLLSSASVEMVYIDQALFEAGWSFFQDRVDKQYSLTDCISFIVMTRTGLDMALTFDHHFGQAGFTKLPE